MAKKKSKVDKKVDEKVEEKIDFKYNLRIYWSLLKKYKGLIFVLVLMITIVELTVLVDKLILKHAIDKSTLFFNGTITQSELSSSLIILAVLFIGVILLRAVGIFWRVHLLNRLEGKSILDMKQRFFGHIVGLSHGFHASNKTGSMISRLVRAGGAFERLTDIIAFDMIPLVIQLTGVIIALLVFDTISAFVVLMVSAVFLTFSLFMNIKLRKANLEYNDREDEEKAFISDILTNIDSIKYFGKENTIKKKYDEKGIRTRIAAIKNWDYYRPLVAGQVFILGAGLLLLLITPFVRFMNGQITIAEIVFIYTVYGNIAGPLFHFVNGIRGYYRSMADFDALFKYELTHNEIIDTSNAKDLIVKTGKLEFRNVTFKYKDRKILQKINLLVPAGKKVAIVGSSGAGKSTMIRLLYRLYNLNEGEILIDGKNIKEFKQESLRSEFSIVPQDCILFDDTIYNNIAFSRPEATKKEVLNAIKQAQLLAIINRMPNKENTIVGERGIKLSGGERQRVSIARAILANKKVLVLDEATSSLDSQTEYEIQKGLKELMKDRTSIIIAHRLSTVMSADMIIVLDEGKIVQTGTHRELIDKKGIYKRLWNLQKGGYLE